MVKIERSDFPDDIFKIVNSLSLFDGKQTVLTGDAFERCEIIATDLLQTNETLKKSIINHEKVLEEAKKAGNEGAVLYRSALLINMRDLYSKREKAYNFFKEELPEKLKRKMQ